MKKRIICICIVVFILLAILFVPIPVAKYDDGGTTVYVASTYKIVKWKRMVEAGSPIYENTSVYWFKDKSASIDELWEQEKLNMEKTFRATVVELNNGTAIVEVVEGESEASSSNLISISISDLDDIGASVGSVVEITYTGMIRETYPASISVSSWKLSSNFSHLEYTESWLDKESAEVYESNVFGDIIITEIWANCFFAKTVIPMGYTIKINGKLPDGFCVGDQVELTYGLSYYNGDDKMETDLISIKAGTFEPDPFVAYKPVIYLYPEKETSITVKLKLNGELTCTYPKYDNGWTVVASPSGNLTDKNGQTYNYLYWEGDIYTEYDMSRGFCVKGEDTASFLEDALERLGLNRREANEFIVYWLPLMENNPYNVISFQEEAYTSSAKLEFSENPDTLIRVFMTWQASDSYIEIEEQHLTSPKREGFTVVEWGGTEIK